MIYTYYCGDCKSTTEIQKPMVDINRPEYCHACECIMSRQLSAKIGFRGEKVSENQTYFNHALGCEVRNDKHAREIAKSRGLIEVGNESQNHIKPRESKYDLTDRDYHDVMGAGEVRGK